MAGGWWLALTLSGFDLGEGCVRRRDLLARQILGAHDLQRALADACADVELAERVGRQRHRRVADVAARLETPIAEGEHVT